MSSHFSARAWSLANPDASGPISQILNKYPCHKRLHWVHSLVDLFKHSLVLMYCLRTWSQSKVFQPVSNSWHNQYMSKSKPFIILMLSYFDFTIKRSRLTRVQKFLFHIRVRQAKNNWLWCINRVRIYGAIVFKKNIVCWARLIYYGRSRIRPVCRTYRRKKHKRDKNSIYILVWYNRMCSSIYVVIKNMDLKFKYC